MTTEASPEQVQAAIDEAAAEVSSRLRAIEMAQELNAQLQRPALAAALTYVLMGRDEGKYDHLDPAALARLVMEIQATVVDRLARFNMAPDAASLGLQ